jgi:hypothetical protein
MTGAIIFFQHARNCFDYTGVCLSEMSTEAGPQR